VFHKASKIEGSLNARCHPANPYTGASPGLASWKLPTSSKNSGVNTRNATTTNNKPITKLEGSTAKMRRWGVTSATVTFAMACSCSSKPGMKTRLFGGFQIGGFRIC